MNSCLSARPPVVRLARPGHSTHVTQAPHEVRGLRLPGGLRRVINYMGVSWNGGTPKSSVLMGFSLINHPFWGSPIYGNICWWEHIITVWFFNMLKHVKETGAMTGKSWNPSYGDDMWWQLWLIVFNHMEHHHLQQGNHLCIYMVHFLCEMTRRRWNITMLLLATATIYGHDSHVSLPEGNQWGLTWDDHVSGWRGNWHYGILHELWVEFPHSAWESFCFASMFAT